MLRVCNTVQRFIKWQQSIDTGIRICYNPDMGNQSEAAYPFFRRGHPPDERKEGDNMVTYSDLIQFCILMVALVGLCYQIFKGKRK